MASVTDDFNRANGGLGANWTTATGSNAPTISSNKVTTGDGGFNVAFYSGVTWTNDHYAQVVAAGGSDFGGPTVRVTNNSNYYQHLTRQEAGTWSVDKVVAGAATTLASGSYAGGSATLKLTITGTAWQAFRNGSSVGSGTDAALASGKPGLRVRSATVDDFEAADNGAATVVSPRGYPLGVRRGINRRLQRAA